jgi:hypothetical protein
MHEDPQKGLIMSPIPEVQEQAKVVDSNKNREGPGGNLLRS